MQVLKNIGLNLLLMVFYFFIGQLFSIKDHDEIGAVLTLLVLLLAHVIFCFLAAVIMHMRGKSDKARMYFISASVPFLLGFILYIIGVMGF